MSHKPNLILLLAAILSLVFYLAAPIMRLAFVLGVNGMNAIRWLSPWFLLPVIALAVAAAASLTGHKGFCLGSAGAVSLIMLILLLTVKDIAAAGNLGLLTQQLGGNAGSVLGSADTGAFYANVITQILVNPAWGFFVSFAVILIGLVGSLFVTEGSTRRNAPGGSARAYSSRQQDYQKLYRK